VLDYILLLVLGILRTHGPSASADNPDEKEGATVDVVEQSARCFFNAPSQEFRTA
jgi:hypothetical protein